MLPPRKNVRLLRCSPARPGGLAPPEWRQIDGGMLLQTPDRIDAPGDDPAVGPQGGAAGVRRLLADLAFAWRACRSVKSNAILLAAGVATVGVGMGQVNRVDSARLAVARAGERAAGRPGRVTRFSLSLTGWRC